MHFRQSIALCLLPLALAAFQIAQNGGFEKLNPNGTPKGWYLNKPADSEATFTADPQNPRSGKYALKIEVTKAKRLKGVGSATCADLHYVFPNETTEPVKCDVALDICAVDVTCAYIVLQAQGAQHNILVWKNFHDDKGTFSWKRVHAKIDFPAGTKRAICSIRVNGTGTLWADNVSLDISGTAAPEPQILTFKGPVKPETGLPEPWLKKGYLGNENVSDTTVKSEGGTVFAEQAWKTGAAHAGFTAPVAQKLLAAPAIQLDTTFRTIGDGKAEIGLEFFDKNGKSLGEATAKNLGDAQWATVSKSFLVPKNAAAAAVILNNSGMGTVQFTGATLSAGLPDNAIELGRPALHVSVYPVNHSMDQQQVNEPEFNTFTDSPTKLTFHFSGDRSRMVKPTLCLDLPAEATIPAAICTHPSNWREEKFTTAPLTRPEGSYVRYTFVNVRAMALAQPTERYQRRLDVLILPAKPGDTFSGKKVFYHLENNDEPMEEHSFNLNILPPMPKTPNPKKFIFGRWNDEDFAWPGDDLFISTLKCQEEANYTWVSRYSDKVHPRISETRKIAEERGWHICTRAGTGHHNPGHFANLEKTTGHKVEFAVGANGKTMSDTLCPTFLAATPEIAEFRDSVIRADIASRHTKPGEFLWLDDEEWHPMDWCFCDRCRKYFAQRNDIDPVPDVATIKKKYPAQWRDFRTFLAARLIQIHQNIANEFNLMVGDYNYVNDYTKPNYKDRYYAIAKNTLENEPYQDLSLISYYHTMDALAFDMHNIERKYLKKLRVPMCAVDGVCGYLSGSEVLTPARFRVMLLAAAVNGSDGYAIYPGERLDAKFYLAADKAMAEIAALEDILHDGAYIDSVAVNPMPLKQNTVTVAGKTYTMAYPQWNATFRYHVRELDGRKVACLLNFNREIAATVAITLDAPLGNRRICEHALRQSMKLPADTRTFLVAVPPMDARFVEISDNAAADWPPAPSQEAIQKDFQAQAAAAGSQGGSLPTPWTRGKLKFSYDATDKGLPVPVLENARQTLRFDAAHGANITSWTVDGTPLCENNGQWMAASRLWTPSDGKADGGSKRTGAIVDCTFADGKASLTMENTFADIKIKLRKTYIVNETDASVAIDTTYTNDTGKTIVLTAWMHSLINPGNAENTLEQGEVEYSLAGKLLNIPRHQTVVRIEVPGINRHPADDRTFDATLKADKNTVRQLFARQNLAITYAPDDKMLTSYNCYNSVKASTVEWMYGAIELKNGESATFHETISADKLK